MTRLSEAGEAITNTLFIALVMKGLPDSYESFVVQEIFQPAKTIPELITKLRYKARCGERTKHGHIAMQAVRKKKKESSSGSYACRQKCHMERECKSRSDSGQSSSRGSGPNETGGSGPKKQRCFKCGQPGYFAGEFK